MYRNRHSYVTSIVQLNIIIMSLHEDVCKDIKFQGILPLFISAFSDNMKRSPVNFKKSQGSETIASFQMYHPRCEIEDGPRTYHRFFEKLSHNVVDKPFCFLDLIYYFCSISQRQQFYSRKMLNHYLCQFSITKIQKVVTNF